ncbi:MAG TPA: helix-hairpin-helix domain-containing protein [Rhodanobacteraceae bacterium]|nr:helix-hairpin-helix domain-containing protein [Rhodanobacteraceae bacterium]
MSRSRRLRRARGFVLLTVLAMVVVLALLATAAAITVSRLRSEAIAQQQRLRGELDAYSTRATVLYLLGTQRMTFAGLTVDDRIVYTAEEQATHNVDPEDLSISYTPVGNEIRLDGRVYRGLGDSQFALQDDRGRLSIDWAVAGTYDNLLRQLKVPVDQRGVLTDRLLDYQDSDDLPRLNGAEAPTYLQRGLPPPPNRPLLTPFELRRVLGWEKYLGAWSDADLARRLSTVRSVSINVNTAPASVLAMLPGVTPAMAQRMVAYRDLSPVNGYEEAQQLLPGLPPETDLVALYPGPSGTLVSGPDGVGEVWQLHWTLTPYEHGGQPWRIDDAVRLDDSGAEMAGRAGRPAGAAFAGGAVVPGG